MGGFGQSGLVLSRRFEMGFLLEFAKRHMSKQNRRKPYLPKITGVQKGRGFWVFALALSAVAVGSSVTSLPSAQALGELDGRGGVPTPRLIMSTLYAENVFLKFVLGSYGKSDQEKIQAVKDATAAIERFAFQPRMMLQVASVAELERIRSLYFPRFYSLQDELDYRRNQAPPAFFTLVSASSDVSDELEDLWRLQEDRLGNFSHLSDSLNRKVSDKTIRAMIFAILDNSNPVSFALTAVSDNARLDIANFMHGEVRKGIEKIDATGQIIADSGGIAHKYAGTRQFLQLAIGEYFRGLDTSMKINIISQFIDNPDRTEAVEKFELMVMSAGPQFQKLFQNYAREEGFSKEMTSIFQRLESSVPPAPWRLVEPIIRAEKVPFEWVEISQTPLGVGTMAQQHLARIRLPNGDVRDVVVRVMKPGIEQRLLADNEVLRRLAPKIDADPILRANNYPLITPFIDEIIKMGVRELNVPATVIAQKKAIPIYARDVMVQVGQSKRQIKIHVPQIYDVGPKSNLIVQEFIKGRGFSKLRAESPELARAAVEEVVKMWVETAFTGSGFYHADIHAGNFLVQSLPGQGVQVNVLDFGMTGQLEPLKQSQIIALAAVIGSNRSDLMAKAMWELSIASENKISVNQLQQILQKELNRLANMSNALPNDLSLWLGLAANNGMKFPSDLVSLSRGMNYIAQMLRVEGSAMVVDDVVKKAITRDPMILRNAMKSMPSLSLFDWMAVGFAGLNNPKTNSPSPRVSPVGGLSCKNIFASVR